MQAQGLHLSAPSSCCSGSEWPIHRSLPGRGQQAALCGEPVCFQQRGRSQRRKATAILDSAVLSREDTRAQEQPLAGPKAIKNNAVELVGNTPMVSQPLPMLSFIGGLAMTITGASVLIACGTYCRLPAAC